MALLTPTNHTYRGITLMYLLLHAIFFGICLHQPQIHDPLKGLFFNKLTTYKQHKAFITISAQHIEQAADISPFLAATLHKLQQNKPVDLNKLDMYGQTALHYAAKSKNPSLVSILLERGANLNIVNGAERTALQIAVGSCNLPIVRVLLSRPSIDINVQDKYAETALYFAAEGGYVSLVEILLRHPTIIVDLPNLLNKTAYTIAFEKWEASTPNLKEKYSLILDKIKAKLSEHPF
jgi:ankyrin repeat protein